MFKKIATTLAATVGVASAQSWTDYAGLCPDYYEKATDFKSPANTWYPKEESISLDDPSLHELVLEFDDAKPKKKSDKVDLSIKCMYFLTQGVDGQTQKQSDRWCVDEDSKTKGDNTDPKKAFPKSEKIPLWNVKRISTDVTDDGIVGMTFTMRYTNFTSPDGYYTGEDSQAAFTSDEIQNKISNGELPGGSSVDDFDKLNVVYYKHPEVLKYENDQWVWQAPSLSDISSGAYLQKYFNVAMIRTKDTISVKLFQAAEDAKVAIGCSVDILTGSTIKAAKFNVDQADSSFFMKNLAFRLQPIKDYYDTIHSYSQNGDKYSVGYDNDFYDGQVEYTANGYSPQSFKWKMSRSRSTSVVATALTIAGALIGTWAF